jgi:hypothetical protein
VGWCLRFYANARHGVNAPSAKKKDLSGLDGELVNGRFRTSGRRDAQDLTLSAKKHGVAVHALCAMSNHYHLIVTDTGCEITDPVGLMTYGLRNRCLCPVS